MCKIGFLVFILVAAGWDLRTKEIPLLIYVFGGGFALVSCMPELLELARSMSVGVFLLVLSVVSREAVGRGDGAFFLVSGMYLTSRENWFLFFSGLLLCSLFSLVLGVWGMIKQKRMWSVPIPFLPFLVPAGIWIVVQEVFR